MLRRLSQIVFLLLLTQPALADDSVLYCTETHIVGMLLHEGQWQPSYDDGKRGKRYAIRFNDNFSEMSGFQGSGTKYRCAKFFPTKARDVVTCTNSKVATMTFSYSTETSNFVMSMTGPGGWLGLKTEREENGLHSDYIIFGKCQKF